MVLYLKALNRIIGVFIVVFLSGNLEAQITEFIAPQRFYDFAINSQQETIDGKTFLILRISKNDQLLFSDSVPTSPEKCTGFSFPTSQPFENYFIFSRREKKNGKTYILSKTGGWTVIAGGTFWAAPKHKLLFILTEADYSNLAIFSLQKMKTVFEKFNCDNFTGWYYYHGSYFGSVEMECGDETGNEKEVSKWMNALLVEEFDARTNTLNETTLNKGQLEKARVLMRYALCK